VSTLFDEATGEIGDVEGCPTCSQALQERLQAEADLQGVERELRKSRREVARLKTELNKQRTQSPEGYRAKAIFRYWVARCEKNASTVFGEKRQEKVIARLHEYPADYIARAIDGLAEGAYTGDNGMRHDDLELVCRDETKLEKYHALAELVGAPTLVGPAWIAEFEGTTFESEPTDAIF